jgi:hypothetical protein
MKTFGQVIMEARKKAGLTQKEVAERLRREDGRKVLPPYLNDLEHDWRYPPENSVIDQAGRDSRARPVLHPRHIYHAVALSWRRSRLGCEGLWNFRADNLPASRNWIPGLQTEAGAKIGANLSSVIGASDRQKVSLKVSLSNFLGTETEQTQAPKMVEAGGIEPPSENRRAVATTRLFRDLISPRQRPRTGCDAASHFVFRGCAQVADGVSLAH